jgi:hypothetical protein
MQWPLSVDHRRQLALDHFFGLPGFALRQRFAHTHDRRDALGQRSLGLVGHQRIGLAVVLAALRMADDGITHAKLAQHGGRHLAGVGARLVAADTSCAPSASAEPLPQRLHLGQIRRGHAHRHVTGGGRPARRTARTSASLAARLPFIFQLPAMSFFLVMHHQVKTILPMCWLDSISACAGGRIGRAKVLWITGLDGPPFSIRARRSRARPARWRP